jgi:hypothetical protein
MRGEVFAAICGCNFAKSVGTHAMQYIANYAVDAGQSGYFDGKQPKIPTNPYVFVWVAPKAIHFCMTCMRTSFATGCGRRAAGGTALATDTRRVQNQMGLFSIQGNVEGQAG